MGIILSRCLGQQATDHSLEQVEELIHNPSRIVLGSTHSQTELPGAVQTQATDLEVQINTIKQSLTNCRSATAELKLIEARKFLKIATELHSLASETYSNSQELQELKREISTLKKLLKPLLKEAEAQALSAKILRYIGKAENFIEDTQHYANAQSSFEKANQQYHRLLQKYPETEQLEELKNKLDELDKRLLDLAPTNHMTGPVAYHPTHAFSTPSHASSAITLNTPKPTQVPVIALKEEPQALTVAALIPPTVDELMLQQAKQLALALEELNTEDAFACLQAMQAFDIQQITAPFAIFEVLLGSLDQVSHYSVADSAKRALKIGISRITRQIAIQMYLLDTLSQDDKKNAQTKVEHLISTLEEQESNQHDWLGKVLQKIETAVRGKIQVTGLKDLTHSNKPVYVETGFRFELEYLSAILTLQQQQYGQETDTIKARLGEFLTAALTLDKSAAAEIVWQSLKEAGRWLYSKGNQRFTAAPKLRGLFYVEGIFRSKQTHTFRDIVNFLEAQATEKSSCWEILYQCLDVLLNLTLDHKKYQQKLLMVLQQFSDNKEWRIREKVIDSCVILGMEQSLTKAMKDTVAKLLLERRLQEKDPRVLLLIQQPDYIKDARTLLKTAWVHSSTIREQEAQEQMSLLRSLKKETQELLIKSQSACSEEAKQHCQILLSTAEKQAQELRIILDNTQSLAVEIDEMHEWVIELKFELNDIHIALKKQNELLNTIDIKVSSIDVNVKEIIRKLDVLTEFKPTLKIPDETTLISYQELLKNAYAQQTIELMLNQEEVPLDKIYVHLAIVSDYKGQQKKERAALTVLKADAYEEIHANKQCLRAEDIFKDRHKQKVRRVLLLGRAGVGKTTLCKKFSYDWATQSLWSEFDYVFQLKFRNMTHDKYPNSEEHYLQTLIARECFSVKHKTPEDRQQIAADLKYIFAHRQNNILLLLDGYDESAEMPENIRKEILAFPNILITSRPYNTESIQSKMDLCIENIGFTNTQINGYIEQFFNRKEHSAQDYLAQGLRKFLIHNPNIQGIAHIPINLQMLCFLWELEQGHLEERMSLSDLYQKMVDHVFESFFHREKIKDDYQKNVLETAYRKVTAMIALRGMEQSKLILDNALLWEAVNTDTSHFKNGIVDLFKLGLIKPISEKAEALRKQDSFFIHLSFQEFFAAWHLSQLSQPELATWLAKHKYHPRYQLLLRFLTKMIYQQQGEKGLLEFFYLLESEPRDLVGIAHLLLMAACLDECENKAELHTQIEQHFQIILRLNQQLEKALIANNEKMLIHFGTLLKNSVYLIKQPALIQLLEAALQDSTKNSGARYLLGEIGSVYPDHVLHLQSLQKGLQHLSWQHRHKVLTQLLQVGAQCPNSDNLWAFIEKGLKEPNSDIQEACVRLLGIMAQQNDTPKLVQQLADILEKKDSRKRKFRHQLIKEHIDYGTIIAKKAAYITEAAMMKDILNSYGLPRHRWQEEHIEEYFYYTDSTREQARLALERILPTATAVITTKTVLTALFGKTLYGGLPENEAAIYPIILNYLMASPDQETTALCLLNTLKAPVFKPIFSKEALNISKGLVSLRQFIWSHPGDAGKGSKKSFSAEVIYVANWLQPHIKATVARDGTSIPFFYQRCASTLLKLVREPEEQVRTQAIAGLVALSQVYLNDTIIQALIALSQDQLFKVNSQATYALKTLGHDSRLSLEQRQLVQSHLAHTENHIPTSVTPPYSADDLDPELRPIRPAELAQIISQLEATVTAEESEMSMQLLDIVYHYPEHHRLNDIIALCDEQPILAKKRLKDYLSYLKNIETISGPDSESENNTLPKIAPPAVSLMNFENLPSHTSPAHNIAAVYLIFRAFKKIAIELDESSLIVTEIAQIAASLDHYQTEQFATIARLSITGIAKIGQIGALLAYLSHPVTEIRKTALRMIDYRLTQGEGLSLNEKTALMQSLFAELYNFNTPCEECSATLLVRYYPFWMGEQALEQQILAQVTSYQIQVRYTAYQLLAYIQKETAQVEEYLKQALHSSYREQISSAFITLPALWNQLRDTARENLMNLITMQLTKKNQPREKIIFAQGLMKLVKQYPTCSVISSAVIYALGNPETLPIRSYLWQATHQFLIHNPALAVNINSFEREEDAVIYQLACWRAQVTQDRQLLSSEIALLGSTWHSNNPLLTQASLSVFKTAIENEIRYFTTDEKRAYAKKISDSIEAESTDRNPSKIKASSYLDQLLITLLTSSVDDVTDYIKPTLEALFEENLFFLSQDTDNSNEKILETSIPILLKNLVKLDSENDKKQIIDALSEKYKYGSQEEIIRAFLFYPYSAPSHLIYQGIKEILNHDAHYFTLEQLLLILKWHTPSKLTILITQELAQRYKMNPDNIIVSALKEKAIERKHHHICIEACQAIAKISHFNPELNILEFFNNIKNAWNGERWTDCSAIETICRYNPHTNVITQLLRELGSSCSYDPFYDPDSYDLNKVVENLLKYDLTAFNNEQLMIILKTNKSKLIDIASLELTKRYKINPEEDIISSLVETYNYFQVEQVLLELLNFDSTYFYIKQLNQLKHSKNNSEPLKALATTILSERVKKIENKPCHLTIAQLIDISFCAKWIMRCCDLSESNQTVAKIRLKENVTSASEEAIMINELLKGLTNYEAEQDEITQTLLELLNKDISHFTIKQLIKLLAGNPEIITIASSELITRYKQNPTPTIIDGLIQALDSYYARARDAASNVLLTLLDHNLSNFNVTQLMKLLPGNNTIASLAGLELVVKYKESAEIAVVDNLTQALHSDRYNHVTEAICQALTDIYKQKAQKAILNTLHKKICAPCGSSDAARSAACNALIAIYKHTLEEAIIENLIQASRSYVGGDVARKALQTLLEENCSFFKEKQLIDLLPTGEEVTTIAISELVTRHKQSPQETIVDGLIQSLNSYNAEKSRNALVVIYQHHPQVMIIRKLIQALDVGDYHRDAKSETLLELLRDDLSGLQAEQLIKLLHGNKKIATIAVSELLAKYEQQSQLEIIDGFIKAADDSDVKDTASWALIELYKLHSQEMIIDKLIQSFYSYGATEATRHTLIEIYHQSHNKIIIEKLVQSFYLHGATSKPCSALLLLLNDYPQHFKLEQLMNVVNWNGDIATAVAFELVARYKQSPQKEIIDVLINAIDIFHIENEESQLLIKSLLETDPGYFPIEQLIKLLKNSSDQTIQLAAATLILKNYQQTSQVTIVTDLVKALNKSSSKEAIRQILLDIYTQYSHEIVIESLIKGLDLNDPNNGASNILVTLCSSLELSPNEKQLNVILEEAKKLNNLPLEEAVNQRLIESALSSSSHQRSVTLFLSHIGSDPKAMSLFLTVLNQWNGSEERATDDKDQLEKWLEQPLQQPTFVSPTLTTQTLEASLRLTFFIPSLLDALAYQIAVNLQDPKRTQILLLIHYTLTLLKQPTKTVDDFLKPAQVLNALAETQKQPMLKEAEYEEYLKNYLFLRATEQKMALYVDSQDNLYYSQENQLKSIPTTAYLVGIFRNPSHKDPAHSRGDSSIPAQKTL